jgi:epoxyqueuosine reductase QueG
MCLTAGLQERYNNEAPELKKLSRIVKEFALIEGACAAGIATVETLAGGPPSTDLSYVLSDARSAVSFAVAVDQKPIAPYLTKKNRIAFEQAYVRANVTASGIALHLANFLAQKGYPAVPVAANNVFRRPESDAPAGYMADQYYPDIAHRYLAVRSGVGHMGLSGNLIMNRHGAAVILGAVVTTAALEPTDPLPPEENYCDDCRLCMASCVAKFMHPKEKTSVTLGGFECVYSRRRSYGRCDPVCSGYTGLHESGKWSTWSPGRFAIPEDEDARRIAHQRMEAAHGQWPASDGGRYFYFLDDKLRVSCANCQLVCCPDKNERKARYKMLTGSGVVIQLPDGRREAVSPDAAKRRLAAMPVEKRALYEDRTKDEEME